MELAEVTSCLFLAHDASAILFWFNCLIQSAALIVMEVLVQLYNGNLKEHGDKCAFNSSKCPWD